MGILGLKFGSDSSNTTNTSGYDYSQNDNSVTTTNSNTYDLSDHSVTNVTDGGAVAGVIGMAQAALGGSLEYADGIFDSALLFANNTGQRMADAFSTAASLQRDTLTSAQRSYSEANKAVADAYARAGDQTALAYKAAQTSSAQAQAATAAAYADAKGTTDSQKQIILGVLAVAGLMALATFSKKA